MIEVAASVPLPAPILGRERVEQLSVRDREILRELTAIFIESGFAGFRMVDLAAALRCSLRALYALGRSKEELFLAVIDGIAFKYGKNAADMLTADMGALDAVEAYLRSGNEMVGLFQGQLGLDIAASPTAAARNDVYAAYGVDVVHALLDLAVERAEIPPVNTGALARLLAGAARDFTRPEAMRLLNTSPQEAANEMLQLVLDGLRGGVTTTARHECSRSRRRLQARGG